MTYFRDKQHKLSKPTLCLVVGVAGSGKTGLAKELVRVIVNAAYISKDLIQSAFTKTERLEGKTYSLIRNPAFQILLDYADTQLSLNKIPVIDAPFSINHWRNDELSDWVTPFKKVAQKHKARLAIIRCVPPSITELKRRIQKRNYTWDKWKLKNWTEFLSREPIDFPISHNDKYEIVTNKPLKELVKQIIKFYLY